MSSVTDREIIRDLAIRYAASEKLVALLHGNGFSNAPHFKEVYATGTEAVLLGNDASGESAIQGQLIDPRFYSLNLTPTEVAKVMSEQGSAACELNP